MLGILSRFFSGNTFLPGVLKPAGSIDCLREGCPLGRESGSPLLKESIAIVKSTTTDLSLD